jgi:hypothetical protein
MNTDYFLSVFIRVIRGYKRYHSRAFALYSDNGFAGFSTPAGSGRFAKV